jgi:hypothetical protein
LAVFFEQDSYRLAVLHAAVWRARFPRVPPAAIADNQDSDAGIGYRDGAKRFVIGVLWDSAAHIG